MSPPDHAAILTNGKLRHLVFHRQMELNQPAEAIIEIECRLIMHPSVACDMRRILILYGILHRKIVSLCSCENGFRQQEKRQKKGKSFLSLHANPLYIFHKQISKVCIYIINQ